MAEKIIKTIVYPGSAENFYALMVSFLVQYGELWKAKNSDVLFIHIDQELNAPTQKVWNVEYTVPDGKGDWKSTKPKRIASITALGELENKTVVRFIDGCRYFGGSSSNPTRILKYECGEIGESFAELAQVIEERSQIEKPKKRSGKRSKVGPNLATQAKINKLKEIRRDAILEGRQIPSWTASCGLAGIAPATARYHAEELRANWDDPDYSPD